MEMPMAATKGKAHCVYILRQCAIGSMVCDISVATSVLQEPSWIYPPSQRTTFLRYQEPLPECLARLLNRSLVERGAVHMFRALFGRRRSSMERIVADHSRTTSPEQK